MRLGQIEWNKLDRSLWADAQAKESARQLAVVPFQAGDYVFSSSLGFEFGRVASVFARIEPMTYCSTAACGIEGRGTYDVTHFVKATEAEATARAAAKIEAIREALDHQIDLIAHAGQDARRSQS